jgi:3-deoxy-D-manno-octulosonic-acid transferase
MRRPEDDTNTGPLIHRVGGRLLSGFIGLTHASSTPPPLWDEHVDVFGKLNPFIMALWHGQFMLLPALPRNALPIRVMLALHKDAEAMAVALRHFDLELIRGAGAGLKGRDRGGANAFRAAAMALAQGYTVAMTADVPPGPARRCGEGIVRLAKVSGRPILPVALASSRFLALNTWSRLTINLPFSRLGGSIGTPIWVPADTPSEDLDAYRHRVERSLDVATADAYGRAGGDLDRATPVLARDRDGPPPPAHRALRGYRAAVSLARPLVPAYLSWRAGKGKEDGTRLGERFGRATLPRPVGRLAWVHAASVGELNAILPMIADLRHVRPDVTLLVTTGTLTAAQLAVARLPAGAIHQFVPLDLPDAVAAFLEHWRPDLGVFTESEIWPNLIVAAADRDVPLAIVNARLSKRSFQRWRRRPSLARPLFARFRVVLAQNKLFALRYEQLGARRVEVVGNLKVDAPAPPVDVAALAALRGMIGARPIWLAASTHPGEEAIIAKAHHLIAQELPQAITLIVPRHPDRGAAIDAELTSAGISVARRSTGAPITASTQMYLADTLGEMGTFLAAAPVVFMGKSLVPPGGGHNPIEPIRLGAAVLSGPSWFNFEDLYKPLLTAGAAREVRSAEDLAAAVVALLRDADARHAVATAGKREVERLSGAQARTLALLEPLLPKRVPPAAETTLARVLVG